MAHFAKVKGGFVIDIHVVNNDVIINDKGKESESLGQKFLSETWGGDPSEYIQCSYNGNKIAGKDRGPYPVIGSQWDGKKFILPALPKDSE